MQKSFCYLVGSFKSPFVKPTFLSMFKTLIHSCMIKSRMVQISYIFRDQRDMKELKMPYDAGLECLSIILITSRQGSCSVVEEVLNFEGDRATETGPIVKEL